MTEPTYREAAGAALAAELEHDDSVILLGEAGGVFKTTEGLQERFGLQRIRDTASVEKTSRLLCVQECPGSWGATVVAEVVDRCWESLDARPRLLSGDDTPIPHAGPLEAAWMPTVESVVAAVRALASD